MLTPYQFSSNSPIANIDLDGEEAKYFNVNYYEFYDSRGKLQTSTRKETEIKAMEPSSTANGLNILKHYLTGSDLKNGILKTYIKTVESIDKTGKITSKTVPLFQEYTPGVGDKKRGGLYLVSEEGGYGHADGSFDGDDSKPINIDLLLKVADGLGGSFEYENNVEKIYTHFFGGKSLEKTTSALEIITNFFENAEKSNHNIAEGVDELIQEFKKTQQENGNAEKSDRFSKKGVIYYDMRLRLNIKRDTDTTGQLTDEKATDTLKNNGINQ